MLKLHHLRDVVAIANAQSVRGAARALGLAQPALTRSVRELEQHLGVQLLVRHARGVSLTDEGARFVLRARAALEEVRRGQEEAQQLAGGMRGTVTIALSGAAILALLPVAYPHFRAECPQVQLRVLEGAFPTLENRLRESSIDFYVGPRPERLDSQAFQIDTWFANRRQIVVRQGHPLAQATHLHQLVDADWLLTGVRERGGKELEELFQAHGLAVPGLMTRVDSMLGILSLLSSTDAVALLPHQCVASPMFERLLQAVPVAETLAALDIVQITRAGLPLTPAAERLATLLRRSA